MQKVVKDKKSALIGTEYILKKLLLNVEAFKKIEYENKRLQKELIDNQRLLKHKYLEDIDNIKKTENEKKDLFDKRYSLLIKKFKEFTDNLNTKIEKEHHFSEQLIKKYKLLTILNKRLYLENKKLKFVLKKNNDDLKEKVGSKFKEVSHHLRTQEEKYKIKHKEILTKYEKEKIDLKNKYDIENKRAIFFKNKYEIIKSELSKFKSEYDNLRMVLEKTFKKVKTYEKEAIVNKKILSDRTNVIKLKFNKHLEEITKEFLDKEIEYKAEIESLKSDLSKYYKDLKESKEKYYYREKKLKKTLETFEKTLGH